MSKNTTYSGLWAYQLSFLHPILNLTFPFPSLYTNSYQISKLILKLSYLLSPGPCFTVWFHSSFWVVIWCSCMHISSSNFFKSFAKCRDKIIFTCTRCWLSL